MKKIKKIGLKRFLNKTKNLAKINEKLILIVVFKIWNGEMNKYKPTKTSLKTKSQSFQEKIWFLLDARGKILGRLAAEVAKILTGKHKPSYTPNIDTGDGVIIINADKIEVTGAKEARKIYRHYTGFMSGLKEVPYRELKAKKPEEILQRAISGMMPKSRLGRQQLKKLKIVVGEKHNMEAQKPLSVNI